MGKEWKAIEELRKEMKELKNDLGLGNQAGKNIQMLLRTIQMQGNEENALRKKFQEQSQVVMMQLQMREDFLGEKKLTEEYTAWYNAKVEKMKADADAKATEQRIANEGKQPEDPALQQKDSEPEQPKESPTDNGGKIERKEITMDEEKKEKQIVTEDKMQDAKEVIKDSKKEIVNDA